MNYTKITLVNNFNNLYCLHDKSTSIKTKDKIRLHEMVLGLLSMQWFFVLLVLGYKYCLSPILPKRCIYTPSCSTYMIFAIRQYGAIGGIVLGVKRILRCHPFAVGGVDSVPDNIRGTIRWLF